uniref:RRM domain-containing protein n=1 Tax=Cyclopterus lumpus TaxID=8103 RepID=A0A8C2XDE4_CYCLU
PSSVETPVPLYSCPHTSYFFVGFCLYVGNLNNTKTFEEVKDSLTNYFMAQSLLVQDIRVEKHAFVDLASEMDLTKGLTLHGEMMHDKPMKIAKAKVKNMDKVTVLCLAAKDDRCLILKNVPYNATKEDIMKIFCQAVDVQFPGGDGSIAFVEFKEKTIAQKVQQQKQKMMIQGRVLTVDCVIKANRKVFKAKDDKEDNTTAETLKSAFEGSCSTRVNLDTNTGVSKGFGFVEFESEDNCKAAKEAMEDCEIDGSKVTVAYAKAQSGEAPLTPGGQPAAQGAGAEAPLTPGGQPAAAGGWWRQEKR